ncbi:MAG: tyrosine--tRNA ligase [Euryarchaeota archaeon]|nr:tyrosine--tRNA ligase [Euryarchaeota archaeon]
MTDQKAVGATLDKTAILELVRRGAEEVVTDEELEALAERLASGGSANAYIGFEPSGSVHLGWVLVANKISDLVEAGFHFKIFLADWHAQINDKLGGDLEAIRACGRYMEHCFRALGVPVERLEFVYANDFANDGDYWARVLKVGKATTLARIRRSMDIMGRSAEEGEKDFSKFIYPAMQVADIFHMDIDLAYGGLDQRHAHMLARDVAKKLGLKPPVALHTPLLPGLKAQGRMDPIEAKMSKSDPDSGIMIHDTPEDLKRKLKKAQCPAGETEGNPVLDMAKHVVFPTLARRAEKAGEPVGPFVIDRPEKFGGPLTFADYAALESAFVSGDLHPADLKNGVTAGLAEVLRPVHEYFAANPEPIETMKAFRTTR